MTSQQCLDTETHVYLWPVGKVWFKRWGRDIPDDAVCTSIEWLEWWIWLCFSNSTFGIRPASELIPKKYVSHFISSVFYLSTNDRSKKIKQYAFCIEPHLISWSWPDFIEMNERLWSITFLVRFPSFLCAFNRGSRMRKGLKVPLSSTLPSQWKDFLS